MDSFSSDEILNDVDDGMPCHKTDTEIAARHHIDILNAWIRCDNFCRSDHTDWGKYRQLVDNPCNLKRKTIEFSFDLEFSLQYFWATKSPYATRKNILNYKKIINLYPKSYHSSSKVLHEK